MNQEQRKQSHAAPVVPMTARDSTGDPNDVLVAAPGHAPHPGQEHSTHTDARYFEESAASTLAFWALDNSHVVAPTRDKQYLPTSISSPSASHKNTALLDSKVTMIDRNATLIASTSADEPPNVPNADNLVDMVVAFAGEHEYTTADQKESSAHSVRHRIAQDQDENKNQDSLNQRRSGEHVQNSYRTTKRNRSYHTSARNSSRTTTTTCSTADDTSQNSFLVNLLQMTTVPAISDGGATVPLPPDVVATNSYPIKMVPSFSSSDSQWERKYKTQTVQMRTVCDLFKDEARNIVLLTLTSFPFRIVHTTKAFHNIYAQYCSNTTSPIGEKFYDIFQQQRELQVVPPTWGTVSSPPLGASTQVLGGRIPCLIHVYPVLANSSITPDYGLIYYAIIFPQQIGPFVGR